MSPFPELSVGSLREQEKLLAHSRRTADELSLMKKNGNRVEKHTRSAPIPFYFRNHLYVPIENAVDGWYGSGSGIAYSLPT